MARVALLIGTGTYAEGLSPLPAAARDVEAIFTVLHDPKMGGFDRVETLIDESHTTIAETIETWFRERQKDDLALLYISGHGVKDAQSNLYFAARTTRKHGEELLRATAVAAAFVRDRIHESRAKRQVIILDCCFSGAIGNQLPKGYETINLEPLLRANDSEALLGAEGRVILTSSSSIQYSFEQREGSLSIYTHYLVEGIRTGAADTNEDGTISVQELHDYASRKVQEESPAMSPKIIVLRDEGYQIRIANAPLGDPSVKYRKEVEAIVQEDGGTIDEVNSRPILRELQAQLKLTDEAAQAIEAEVLEPIIQRRDKLEQYRNFFITVLGHNSSLGERERRRLRQFQQLLGLLDENVKPIEAEILNQIAVQSPKPVDNDSDENGSSSPPQKEGLQNSRKILLVGVGVVAVLLGGYGLSQFLNPNPSPNFRESPSASPSPPLEPIQNLISAGDNANLYGSRSSSRALRGLVTYRDQQSTGISQFRANDYVNASKTFSSILSIIGSNQASNPRKDPEILVFLNNSQARLNYQKGEPIYTIAAAVPLSDADEESFNIGQQILFGIAQAQTKALNDGINLEVVIANDRNVPQQAEKLAEELAKPSITGYDNIIKREILAVIGHYSSTVTCAALPFYNRAKLAIISPASTRTDLRSTCNGGQVFFRTTSSSEVEAQALVDYLVNNSKIDNPKVAIFYKKGEGFSQDLTNAFMRILGNRIQAPPLFDLSDSEDFKRGKNQLDEFNVLAIFPDGRTSDDTALNSAIKLLETSSSQLILGANPFYDAEVSQNSSLVNADRSHKVRVQPHNPGKGLVVAIDWFPGCGSNTDFIAEANRIWGGDPNRIYAASYEAVQVIVDRLDRKKTTTRADFLSALGNSQYTVKSYVFQNKTISFDPNGDRNEIKNRILITPQSARGFEPIEGFCSP